MQGLGACTQREGAGALTQRASAGSGGLMQLVGASIQHTMAGGIDAGWGADTKGTDAGCRGGCVDTPKLKTH